MDGYGLAYSVYSVCGRRSVFALSVAPLMVTSGPFTIRWRSGWIAPSLQMAITFAVEPCNAVVGRLQVIQALWASRRFDGQPIGHVLIHSNGVDYDACVDAGRFSPAHLVQGQPLPHPNKPYFYSPVRLAEEVYGCHVRLNDTPVAVKLHRFSELHTAIVLTEFDGPDRVLASYRWGYTCAYLGADPVFSHQPLGGAQIDFPEESCSTSAEFKAIVHHDYPQYHFVEC